MFNEDEEQPNVGLVPGGKTYQFDDQIFSEIEVDETPPEDDESTVWTDAGDNVEEVSDDEMNIDNANIVDMSHCTFSGHKDSVYCVAAHPLQPGVVITGGGDDVAYIWKYDINQQASDINEEDDMVTTTNSKVISALELLGHTDTVTAVGFNFNGSLALTGSYDGTVRIWKVESGELIQTLDGPEDIEWAELHSKGNAIIAGSRDGSIWMWLTQNGQCVQVFAGHDGPVTAGCFSSDGKLVCSGGEDGTVRLWMPKTGACRHVFEGHFGHEAMVTSVACHVDGDLLLSGSADGTMKLFQLSGKKVLQKFVHSDPSAVVDSSETAGLSSNVFSKMSTIAETTRGGDMDDEDEDEEQAAAMAASAEDLESLSPVECVGFAKGGFKWVASGGMDKNLKVWDMTSGSCRCVCAHGGSVVALRWHETLPVICTAALDNVIRIWDARNGALLSELTGHRDLVTNLDLISMRNYPGEAAVTTGATDVIVSVSDDKTSRVFLVDMNTLLA